MTATVVMTSAALIKKKKAAGPTVLAPSVPDAADNARQDDTATFEQTGNPLLLIGRDSGRRSQGDRAVSLDLRSFQ